MQGSYAKDVQVMHGDKTWISMADNNVWEPGVWVGSSMRVVLIATIFLALLSQALADWTSTLIDIKYDGKQAVIFSAELNLSNGNPYTRDFGERGMFGKLVTGETVAKNIDEYIDDADRIFAEAKRLIFGPWENGGKTELSFYKAVGGKQLDLDTGKWVKSKGGDAIRLRHTTEYMGKIRYAYILTDSITLWKRGD